MPAHGCITCPESLGCCICEGHDHSREIFAAAAALMLNDVDDPYLPSLAEAQDSFRLCEEILSSPRTVRAELFPKGETLHVRIEGEEYMLTPTRLLAERLPQDDDEEAVLTTLWDLLSEDY